MHVSNAEYWNEVNDLAQEAVELTKHQQSGFADVYEAASELVDGHQWIIFYTYNDDVLEHTLH